MKFIFTLLVVSIFSIQLNAQASAVVFSEAGEKFTLYLNGEKKNPTASANVKVNGLSCQVD